MAAEEKREPMIGFRVLQEERSKILSAAEIVGEEHGNFARKATLDRADRVLKKHGSKDE